MATLPSMLPRAKPVGLFCLSLKTATQRCCSWERGQGCPTGHTETLCDRADGEFSFYPVSGIEEPGMHHSRWQGKSLSSSRMRDFLTRKRKPETTCFEQVASPTAPKAGRRSRAPRACPGAGPPGGRDTDTATTGWAPLTKSPTVLCLRPGKGWCLPSPHREHGSGAVAGPSSLTQGRAVWK